jgi:hypothetical protein
LPAATRGASKPQHVAEQQAAHRRLRARLAKEGFGMEAWAHGFVAVAAVLAGLVVAAEIEGAVKGTVRRWWQSLNQWPK